MGSRSKSTSRSQPASPKPSAPPSRAHSVAATPTESSQTRRRRSRKKSSKATTPKPEELPGSLEASKPSRESTPQPTKPTTSQTFGDQEFIPFELYDVEEEKEPELKRREQEVPVREWDRGKKKVGRDTEAEHASRKRKVDEVDHSDGYSSKKYKADPGLQKAPWVWDMDVDSCTNVAQL